MQLLKTIAVAFSMFSAVPMPQFDWEEKNMRYMLCAFPLVGALIGAAQAGWGALCSRLSLPSPAAALGLCLLPVLISGGIHLDGFCDTHDALASRADPEKKRQILKDPHIGSFAVIHLVMYFMILFVIWMVLPEKRFAAAGASYVLSRSLSAAAVASFPIAPGAGLARTFADTAHRGRVLAFSLVLSAACVLFMGLNGGIWMAGTALVVFLWYRFVLIGRFGGLSGDLAGWFVETAQLWMLIALYAGQLAEGLR